MVAVSLLTVALVALAGVTTRSMISLRDSRQRQQATVAASRALEGARALRYAELGIPYAEIPGNSWDPDGAGTLLAEVVCTPGVVGCATALVTGSPFRESAGGLGVRTTVTWVNAGLTGGVANRAKRVTAVVTWTSGSAAREVRQSTVVTPPERGVGP